MTPMKALLYSFLLGCVLMGCNKNTEKVVEPDTCKFVNYYYIGDSIASLGELDNEYIIVGFNKKAKDSQIKNFINSEKEFAPNYNYTTQSYQVPLKLKQPKSCQDITAFIAKLQKDTMITFVHYTMKTDCRYSFMPIIASRCIKTYSEFFNVKVKDTNDLTHLNATIKFTSTQLVEQNRFSPQWFTLKADKNSKGDALSMANYFKESKLFERVEPIILFTLPVE